MIKPPTQNDVDDRTRLVVAAVISLLIIFAYKSFFQPPPADPAQQQQGATAQNKVMAVPAAAPAVPAMSRGDALSASKRIPIHGNKISGSIALSGARIDDLSLDDQHASLDTTEHVQLLSPGSSKDAYYVESGWTSDDKTFSVPDEKTVWQLAPGSAPSLEINGSITLQWDNGQGLSFQKQIALDDHYLFTVTQRVSNKTAAEKKFNAWHLISRHSLPPDFKGFFILHEGPLAYLGKKVEEMSYKSLAHGDVLERENTQGWTGITDKYWFVGILPPANEKFSARIIGSKVGQDQAYQTDIVSPALSVSPGQTIEDKKYVFAGVKNLPLMTEYQEKYGLPHLDLTFDFGMWYFITKPFYFVLHMLMSFFGNVGIAILAMTVIVRTCVFPLASKSYRSMAGMKKITPQMKELQEKYGKDRQRLQMEIFELYKKEDVNPFSGCWPVLIQIPIFFALYKSILLSVELRHTPFWGWIRDLSAPDPTNMFNLFGLIPWSPPGALQIGAWPVLFCLTMIVQKRLTPPMPDKAQEQIQSYMPFLITVMLARFAAGLVIYWTWSNVLSVLQQYYILRKLGGQDVSLLRGHAERQKKKKKKHG